MAVKVKDGRASCLIQIKFIICLDEFIILV